MAAKSKIKKDEHGLYTVCGGWISRPVYGTQFQEGEEVKTHHFGGSSEAGVTVRDKPDTHHFKKGGQYEVWSTTGISNYAYQLRQVPPPYDDKYKDFPTYLRETTEWYEKSQNEVIGKIYKEENQKFRK